MYVRSSKLRLGLCLYTEQALDDYVIDLGPHMRTVDSELFEVRAEGRHAPFEATIALLSILVLHERLILFVD